MNISELLSRNARKFPNKEAVISPSERLTYLELDDIVNRFSSSLLLHGVQKGDRIVLFLPNTAEFIVSYLSVLRIGAIAVPINAKLTNKEVAYIVSHCSAKMIIAHDWLKEALLDLNMDNLIGVKTGQPMKDWLSFEELVSTGSKISPHCLLNEDDEASILYTSGTTGHPKGVLFTYRNILTSAIMMAVEMAMKPESRILHMMPLSHSAPLHLFLVAGLYVGAVHIVYPAFTPDALAKIVNDEKVTHFFGAPVAYLFTAKLPDLHSYNLSSVSHWVYGGAPLSSNQVQYIQEKLQSDQFYCVYGLTEAGPSGTLLTADEHALKAGSIGCRAALNTELRIVDEKGDDVAPETVGEIVLYGEGIMKGYYQDPEKTADCLIDGWLKTGDLAKRDEDGYIWVVDRKKDMIITGGVNVYPKEIEEELVKHPSISEAAVVGVPHSEWGETVKAFVVTINPIEDLERICKSWLDNKLADYKIPKLFERVEELPRNATGKVLKHVLKEIKSVERV